MSRYNDDCRICYLTPHAPWCAARKEQAEREQIRARVWRIPLPGRRDDFTFSAPFPLTQDDWDYVHRVLSLMQPGLTTAPPVDNQENTQ